MGESKQEHLIVGVSPFNPRFTPEWLSSAFQWGAERFSTVDVLHPGEISMSLLTSTGTPLGRAKRKVRQQCNRDMRNVEHALEISGIKLGRGKPVLISDYLQTQSYQCRRRSVIAEFQNNQLFQDACRAMSRAACQSRLRVTNVNIEPDIETAVKYIFDELPAYTHCSDLFEYETAALGYPTEWPIGKLIESGLTSLGRDPNNSFIVIDFEKELIDD